MDTFPRGPPHGKGRVATLGMFIIDHFEVRDEHGNAVPADEEAMGGGGIYAATAARIFLPPSHVAFIADVGADMPARFEAVLRGFGKGMVWLRPREGLTTRALNMYSGQKIGEGHQTFRYLSPQKQITPADYFGDASPFRDPPPAWLHVVCDTDRAAAVVAEVEGIRARGWTGGMVWEPLIRRIEPGSTATYVELARHFAVFRNLTDSPNLLELLTILDLAPVPESAPPAAQKAAAESAAAAFEALFEASSAQTATPAIVVRCGALGAYTRADEWEGWVPAFWRPEENEHVVDPTGGGNGFLGGFCAGLLLSDGSMRAASIYASTAASFVIEQRGLPVLSLSADGEELWNGDSPMDRLREMTRRTAVLEVQ
ncbi:hypothetical protein Q5752_004451 [Cryptotrichosporon argae]